MPSSAYFVWDRTLGDLLDGVDLKLADLTPVMVQISEDMRKFIVDTVFPTAGEGKWQGLASSTLVRDRWKDRASSGRPGRIGPLQSSGWMARSVYRDASKVNAAAITKAPHAHLHEYGTKAYPKPLYVAPGANGKKRRRSDGEVKRLRERMGGGHMRVTPRVFMYVDESRAENLYPFMVLDYVFAEFL